MKPIQLGHNPFDYDIEFSTNNDLEIDELIGHKINSDTKFHLF